MSKHCEHCTDSCDLYFDVSERLHTSGNAAWASGHCPYCNADMGKFIPHGERDLKFLREGHRRGRRDEREVIVAWLRSVDNGGVEQRTFWSWAADDIERGEHLIGGPVINPLRGAVATGYSIGIKDDDE